MSRQSEESIAVGAAEDRDFQPSDEVLGVRRVGGMNNGIPAARRLLRVLVADDNKDAADSLSKLVKMWGHDVRWVYDGAAAFEMTSIYRPDVLLLDIAMPKMNGCHLVRQLRRQTCFKDAVLIAITGYADEAHRLLSMEAGFDHYLVKPVGPSTLEDLLLLQQSRLAESPEIPPAAPRTYGILVADDEPSVRGVLSVTLRQQGFAVWLAADGWEALDLYWQHAPAIDVVMLDVLMPGLDGPQTLAALQELNPQVRCCFMSGHLGDYTEGRLRELGAAIVLPKPFRLDEVTQVLGELAGTACWSPSSV
jgi:CheY-like chemotaxis protein